VTNTLDPQEAGGSSDNSVRNLRRQTTAEPAANRTSATGLDALRDLADAGWDALQLIGRSLHVANPALDSTLAAVVEAAVELVPDAEHAGINLYVRGRFLPQALYGKAPEHLDVVQQELDDGPCIAASRDQQVVRVDDMGSDDRWPRFAQEAISVGVHAMLCLPLYLDEQRLGSLSLYSSTTAAFDDHARRIATLLGTHAAIAVADARRNENLQRALLTRDTIGQAKGILMERHRITAQQAFDLLTRASQNTNTKLADVAETVASTGALPQPQSH
jgi:GAF domain-containing protein